MFAQWQIGCTGKRLTFLLLAQHYRDVGFARLIGMKPNFHHVLSRLAERIAGLKPAVAVHDSLGQRRAGNLKIELLHRDLSRFENRARISCEDLRLWLRRIEAIANVRVHVAAGFAPGKDQSG